MTKAPAYLLDTHVISETRKHRPNAGVFLFANRVLPVDMAVARRWGEFPAARNLPVSGTLIAATAITLGLILVTRNENDVAATGVRLVNPLTTPQNSTP